MIPTFHTSIHCTSGEHCRTCRNTGPRGQAFRADMVRRYPELGTLEFPCPQQRRWGWQLGDMVASVATPVERALKLDCVDAATAELKPESPCARRKRALNSI